MRFKPGILRPSPGLIDRLTSLVVLRSKQDLPKLFGLALQLQKFQCNQSSFLHELAQHKAALSAALMTNQFATVWYKEIRSSQANIWECTVFSFAMRLVVDVDASAAGYAGILIGTGKDSNTKVIAMFSSMSPGPHHHSATSELKVFIRSLSSFRRYVRGKPFRDNTALQLFSALTLKKMLTFYYDSPRSLWP